MFLNRSVKWTLPTRATLECFARFRVTGSGAAAIEFALVLPLLLLFYGYLVEFSRAFDESRKLDRLSSTLADIVSQQPTGKQIPASTIASLLSASPGLMTPFATSNLSATLSVVKLSANADGSCCSAAVAWSFTQNGTLRPCGTLAQVANGTPPGAGNILASVVVASRSGSKEVVVADVHDPFPPLFTGLLPPLFSSGFSRTVYIAPRGGSGQLTLQTPIVPQTGQQAQVCS